jgi:hypothetical protein
MHLTLHFVGKWHLLISFWVLMAFLVEKQVDILKNIVFSILQRLYLCNYYYRSNQLVLYDR